MKKAVIILLFITFVVNITGMEPMTAQACWAPPRELDVILADCYSIVRGRLVAVRDSEPRDYSLSIGDWKYYTFDITAYYMGNMDGVQNVELTIFNASAYSRIESRSYMHIGNEYLLLIGKTQSISRGDSYQCGELIIGLDADQVDGVYYIGKEYPYDFPQTMDEMKQKIDEFYDDPEENGIVFGLDYTESEDVQEIVEYSQHIAQVRILENKSVQRPDVVNEFSHYKTQVTQNIKGELPEEIRFSAPTDQTVIGDEYLVLLMSKEDNQASCGLSSHHSYIPLNDTKTVEEYLDAYAQSQIEDVQDDLEEYPGDLAAQGSTLRYGLAALCVLVVVIGVVVFACCGRKKG